MAAEPIRLRGRAAAPGLAVGPARASWQGAAVERPYRRLSGRGATALRSHRRGVGAAFAIWRAAQDGDGADILEFQIALLEDDELTRPALAAIAAGAPAARAWGQALDAQIADYRAADDPYFRARAADLADLRDRVLRALAGVGEAAPSLPDGAIVVAEDLPPSRFLEIDWTRFAGVALTSGSATSHVAMLARARGVPMVVGLGAFPATEGALALLDAEQGEIEIDPTPTRIADWRPANGRRRRAARRREDAPRRPRRHSLRSPCPCTDQCRGARRPRSARSRACGRHRAGAHRIPV